ncbi:DUF3696 domain-containing protein [Paenibacillus polygoni]|uniref:DUF3696 domain-containing protein n=1 Tax=Paenibacillus polygoni TaxID=3050112 RepID=A0ABY8X6W9_9BACL|nr:DUF3696 domain-containing protein [Paenibacillus polygoni]WIV19196.1 DUF3696 domain-containing protein [Paenibacillus polygoni]
MIERVELKNFKCFKDQSFKLKSLNVLSGLNGTGKSTFIQSLLLPIQAAHQKMLTEGLVLNGDMVELGTGKDLLCEFGDEKNIKLGYRYDDKDITFNYSYHLDKSFLPIKEINGDLGSFTKIIDNIQYISALRIAPKSVYPESDYNVIHRRQLGNGGEYSIQYLSEFSLDEVQNEELILNHIPEKYLKNQLHGWFNLIVPNTQLDVDKHLNTELVSLKYRFRINETEVSNFYRPANVGFGITYVLPVILSLLKARKNDIVIIENPEAHLHPAGQRKMGELISLAAAGGIQVIVETHSDHVLNGIRLSIKNEQINNNDVNIMFFERVLSNDITHVVHTPEIKRDGRLTYWPDGFFDEWDKAIEELF